MLSVTYNKPEKMKPYIILYLCTLVGTTCIAQNIPDPTGMEAKENIRELGSLSGTGNVRTFDNRYEGTRGTPYVFEDWVPGEVLMKDDKRVVIREMNYNCYDNEVAYLDPSTGAVMLINKYTIDRFQVIRDGDTLLFVPVQLDQDKTPIFAQVLYAGKSALYKVYGKDFVRANYEGAYSADRKYDEFADKSSLHISTADVAGLTKVRKTKKQVLAALPAAEKALSAFIKSEDLDLKLEEDLVRLLGYYDSL